MQIHMQRLRYKISCRPRKCNLGVDLDPSELHYRTDKGRYVDVDIPLIEYIKLMNKLDFECNEVYHLPLEKVS